MRPRRPTPPANPDINWTIVDFGYDPDDPNVRELVYQTDEAAFAAGYLAAGVSQTGVIGTYGGLNIPTVAIFMDGLARGVAHYNEVNGTDVQVVGWDVEAQDGTFTGTFDPGDPVVRQTCESILDEGADIMLPVGGAINLPCGVAIQDRGLDAALIGVDQDAFEAMPPEYQDLWLVTIEKGIAIQVERSLQEHAGGMWTPGGVVGNLGNDAVGLSEFHSWEDRVPPELAAEVDQILADIRSGDDHRRQRPGQLSRNRNRDAREAPGAQAPGASRVLQCLRRWTLRRLGGARVEGDHQAFPGRPRQ